MSVSDYKQVGDGQFVLLFETLLSMLVLGR